MAAMYTAFYYVLFACLCSDGDYTIGTCSMSISASELEVDLTQCHITVLPNLIMSLTHVHRKSRTMSQFLQMELYLLSLMYETGYYQGGYGGNCIVSCYSSHCRCTHTHTYTHRMLREILNTRIMVKQSMKLHKNNKVSSKHLNKCGGSASRPRR